VHRKWSPIIENHILKNQLDFQQASLAQLVERGTSNAEVTGSTPLGGMSFCSSIALCQTCNSYFCCKNIIWRVFVMVVVVEQKSREGRCLGLLTY
jgi:hypothetical protein